MEILKMKGVSLTYQTPEGETTELDSVDLSIDSGEFVAVIGPSGCGKTTVLSLIAGLMKPTAGEILLDGKPVTGTSCDVGYMLQRDQLFEWRTILSNCLLGPEIQKTKTPESVAYVQALLQKYGLQEFE